MLTAGRETDEKVARALGLPIEALCSDKNVDYVGAWDDPSGYQCGVCYWKDDFSSACGQETPHPYTPPPYSTDDATAFRECWPWLCERFDCVMLTRDYSDIYVTVQKRDELSLTFLAQPTVALALNAAVLEVAHEGAGRREAQA